MPYHKVGQADLEFSSRKSEAEFNLAINRASFGGEHRKRVGLEPNRN